MPQTNSAIHNPYRRKVTLACGSCRRRRVKCSGTQPCTLCSESGRQCEFDNSNRGRRGPRPRQPGDQAGMIIRPLAPLRPPAGQKSQAPISLAGVATEPVRDSPAEEASIQIVDQDVSEDKDDEGGSSADEISMPDPSQWKPGLEKLLYGKDSISEMYGDKGDAENRFMLAPWLTKVFTSLPGLDVYLICHFLEIFCTRSSAHLRPLLLPGQIQQHLSQDTISRSLILSACAASVRFTVRREARGHQARRFAEAIEREARRHIEASKIGWKQVDNIKAVCFLLDYEASRGNGRQAWVDNAMGRSMLQLARSGGDLDAEQTQALSVAERYLSIAQITHGLGHPSLQRPCDLPAKKPRPETECMPCASDCPHLVELLEVLASIHHLCSTPFKEQHPPPWAAESKFRALQDELEEYLLRHPEIFNTDTTSSPWHRAQGGLEVFMASLVWHCCAIVLNRTFLPIPETPEESAGGECRTTPIPCVQFPGAPPLFLKERIYRCESSADAICEISRHVIRSGGFYSNAPLLGLACTHSALVSINRLHRSWKPRDERIVENLNIAMITIRALKPIHDPAGHWLDALFRVYDRNTPLTHTSETVDLAFNSYFSRFLDVEEPPFMPLDRKDSHTPGDTEGAHQTNEVSEQSGNENPVESRGQGQNAAPDKTREWVQAYAGHLSADIGEDSDMEAGDESLCSAGLRVESAQRGTGAQTVPVSATGTGQVQGNMGAAPGDLTGPLQVADTNLTSMSDRAPGPVMPTQDTQPGHQCNGGARESITADVDDNFLELFGPIVSFPEVAGLDAETGMLPGLGPMGGPDMWSDMFDQDMLT